MQRKAVPLRHSLHFFGVPGVGVDAVKWPDGPLGYGQAAVWYD